MQTTLFYAIPKERMANILSQDGSYRVTPDGGVIVCQGYQKTITLSDYVIRERIYAGPTLGFVQGIVGTKAVIDAIGEYGINEVKQHSLNKVKEYLL